MDDHTTIEFRCRVILKDIFIAMTYTYGNILLMSSSTLNETKPSGLIGEHTKFFEFNLYVRLIR